MRLIPRQKFWLALIIVANLTLWIIPSDVVENIARDRHTLLGRYTRTHFSIIVAFFIFSLVSFYVDWSTGEKYKRRWFTVIASLLVLTPSIVVIDYLIRSPEAAHYVREGAAYHRPAGFTHSAIFEDRPQAHRSFRGPLGGYGTVRCDLHVDSRGYRNPEALTQAEIVVLGDSFAEGSNVSDEHAWPRRLADLTGKLVYNLGMSGYDPFNYLAALQEIGLGLKPRYVLCGLYEGNDFRSAKSDRKRMNPSISKRMEEYVKRSPLLNALDRLFITQLGPINCSGPVAGGEVLEWMPIRFPEGPNAKAYWFAPKQLRDLIESRETFAINKHWINSRRQLEGMRDVCREAGATFVLVYTPVVAQVILPAVADRLVGKQVRDYLALDFDYPLPEGEVFLEALLERADDREAVVADWCWQNDIPFVSLTEPLRSAAASGTQVYYTWDQHWTPDGHRVAAETVAALLTHLDTDAPETASVVRWRRAPERDPALIRPRPARFPSPPSID